MTNTTKKETKHGSLSKKAAIIGGAVAGAAAISVAAAVALKNKQVQKGLKSAAATVADAVEKVDAGGYKVHHKVTEQLHKVTKPAKKSAPAKTTKKS